MKRYQGYIVKLHIPQRKEDESRVSRRRTLRETERGERERLKFGLILLFKLKI